MDINRHLIIGNLGDDPRYFNDPSKNEMTVFSVATTLRFQGSSGTDVEDTEWHRVVAYGWRATIASEFRKGERVYIEGYVRTRPYVKDGKEGYVKEIVAQTLHSVRAIPKTEQPSRVQNADARTPRQEPSNEKASQQMTEGALY